MNYKTQYITTLYGPLSSKESINVSSEILKKNAEKVFDDNPEWTELPEDVIAFYKEANGIKLEWKNLLQEDCGGGFDIVPASSLFLENAMPIEPNLIVVNDDFNFSTIPAGYFRKMVRMPDDRSVGFFSDPAMGSGLYYENGHRFYDLKLGFEGYFKMLCLSKAFQYWEYTILSRTFSFGKVNADWFVEQMTSLFPEFSYSDFMETYASLQTQ